MESMSDKMRFNRKICIACYVLLVIVVLCGCGQTKEKIGEKTKKAEEKNAMQSQSDTQNAKDSSEYITEGTEEYRGFLLDNVLHSETEGEIHYNVYIPDSYDGSRPFALFFTLPGYEGLLVLDVKDSSYFESRGITNQHGGGGALFSNDGEIMGWLFGK